MSDFVPFSVRECNDPVLKTRGMNVRGTLEQRNQAFGACNDKNQHEARKKKASALESKYAETLHYFRSQPPHHM